MSWFRPSVPDWFSPLTKTRPRKKTTTHENSRQGINLAGLISHTPNFKRSWNRHPISLAIFCGCVPAPSFNQDKKPDHYPSQPHSWMDTSSTIYLVKERNKNPTVAQQSGSMHLLHPFHFRQRKSVITVHIPIIRKYLNVSIKTFWEPINFSLPI